MDEAEIIRVIEQKIDENDYNDCYLVDLVYNQPKNHLTVYMGSDSGMTLAKCQAFSRHIESYLDETLVLGEKYELDVSSPGLDRRSEEHTSELQSRGHLVCRLLLEKKKEK